MTDRIPYAGEGVEGARLSAQIDRQMRDSLEPTDFATWASLSASAWSWDAQADRLEGIERVNCPECRGTHDHREHCSRRDG